MYRAAIFDLDGTIAETTESMAKAGNIMLEEIGLKKRPVKEYKYFAGDGAKTLVERALKAAGAETEEYFLRAYKRYMELFEEYCMYKVEPIQGVPQVTKKMKERGISIAVLTNKPHDEGVRVVESLFGSNYFDIILGQKEDMPKKPNPSGALYIAQKFNAAPSDCIYVGDTNVDMKTGKSAGMFTVGVLWGFRTKEELEKNHADAIIRKPEELLQIAAHDF